MEQYVSEEQKKAQLITVAFFYVLFMVAAWIWTSYQTNRPSPLYLSQASQLNLFRDLLLGVLSAFLVVAFSQATVVWFKWARILEGQFQRMLCPLGLFSIAWISLWSSLGEEFLFRGAMQPVFGLVVTSLIFGLFHFPVRKILLPWTFISVAVGLMLGGLFEYTGNLLPSLVCHFSINFINLYVIQSRYDRKIRGREAYETEENQRDRLSEK